jgi:hypothetical protein
MKTSVASDPPIKTQGDFGWDAVLEYRVWCLPELDVVESEIGSDYYFAFVTNESQVQPAKVDDKIAP